MDHDQQIKSEQTSSRKIMDLIFDQSHIQNQDKAEHFSLENEFKKTKRNRNIRIGIILALFTFIMWQLTYLTTYYIEKNSLGINIAIKDFEDLNLLELINKARENEKKLNQIQAELLNSKKSMQVEISRVQEKTKEQIKRLLKSRSLPTAQKRKLISQIKKQESNRIESLESSYRKTIQKKEKQLQSIQKNQKKYRSLAKQSEVKLNKMKVSYAVRLAKEKRKNKSRIQKLFKKHRTQLKILKKVHKKNIAIMKSRIKTLQNELKQKIRESKQNLISQKKKDKEKLSELKQNYGSLEDKLKNELETLKKSLLEKNSILKIYRDSMLYLVNNNREHGYIIGLINQKNVLIALNSSFPIENNTQALIFNQKNKVIAKIELYFEESQVKGKIIESTEAILPFYKILITLNRKKG